MTRALFAFVLALAAATAVAAEAPPTAADPAVEARLNRLSEELRCLVCQNESLAGSRADLAVDLRREIREQIASGRSDAEIMDFMVGRYGDFVRYRPPWKATTVLLWLGPLLFLAGGIAALLVYLRRRARRVEAAPFSPEDERRLASLVAAGAEADPGATRGKAS
jgi:cytochrome c-type biogenesis protein CcmH